MKPVLLSILLGLGGMFGWGIYDFLGGIYSKQVGSFKSLFWSQLAGFIAIALLALSSGALLRPSPTLLLLSLAAAILYAAGYLFFFKGFEKGSLSIIAATMNLWAVFTMLFAFLWFGQRLSPLQTLGVLLILLGATLASLNWREIRTHRFQLSAGVREALLGAFFFGIFWNVSELISERAGWLPATLYIKLGIALFLPLLSLPARQPLSLQKTTPKTRVILACMGIIEVGAVALINYGLTIGDAILITPIASALSLVTITLAVLFLKDRLTKIQALGIAAAITGIILTAL